MPFLLILAAVDVHALTAWLAAHPAVTGYLIATAVAVYRSRTAAQWVALGERVPRVQGLIRLARGGGFDPVRVLEGAMQVVTGRRIPDPRELVIAAQAAELTSLRASLADYQRRAVDSHAVTEPTPFDPSARQTIAPDVVDAAKRASDQAGHVEGSAMLGACVLALAASLLCAGCPWVREGAMRASVVVADPTDCVPLATRCVAGVPVVCSPSPVPGSNRHREWPMLPRDGRGMQRACADGCVVDDAGAHCVAADAAVDAAEGGAL